MKIALICSHGGHLTEILYLMKAFEGNEVFFITYNSPRTSNLNQKKYLLNNIGTNPFRMLLAFFKFFRIFTKERPEAVLSTGSEIAIPGFYIAKLLGIRTIFIESWCRVRIPSFTGRAVYYISDLFLVQWPTLLEAYGSKAKYAGAVV